MKEFDSWGYMNWISGGHSGGVTPGSMPNPAVKPSSADGTAEAIRGRVGRCRKSFFYWITDETEHCEAESFRPQPEILRFFRALLSVILSEAIAVAQHPERSGGSIPGGDGKPAPRNWPPLHERLR